jgi:hypothetical protein
MTLSGALIATVPDDGEAIFLQASGGGRTTHTVSVFVDLHQGGIAKHIALLEPIGAWADSAFGPDGQLGAECVSIPPARASERIVEAIGRTDECPHPIIGETFVELRAFALARAGSSAGSRPGVDAAWLN